MQRIMNSCSILLFGFSLFALTLGVAQGFNSTFGRQTEGLRCQEMIKSIGDISAGKQVDVTIALENPSSREITILGGSRACYPYCCVTFEGPSRRISALTQGTVRLHLVTGRRTGEFQVPVTFYTNCDGQPELTIEVKGRVVADSPVLTFVQQ